MPPVAALYEQEKKMDRDNNRGMRDWLIWRPRAQQTQLFSSFRDYVERRWNGRPQMRPSDAALKPLQPDFLTAQDDETS
ncbi:hypothetical protein V462_00080 [Pantoea ananatis 15320]|nr:hypothetical protein V462_00080 [Pantoea ananatis 15320]